MAAHQWCRVLRVGTQSPYTGNVPTLHYVARLIFVMAFVQGNKNLADILTKAQAAAVFNQLMTAYDAFVVSQLPE